jgi:hypothetical protein
MSEVNRVVEILCRRDGISVKEAVARVREVQEQINSSNFDYDEVEDIMASELGLEMDYIFDIL